MMKRQRMFNIIKFFTFSLYFVFLLSPELLSQVKSKSIISGQITDARTGEPLPNVNLFFAYTTIGSITNKEGKYIIKNIPSGQFDLIVSHIGYEMTTFQFRLLKSEILVHNFQLTPRVIKGEQVQVETTTPEEWKKNLKRFIELFIGKTKNSLNCKILNPEVINFEHDSKTNIFTAFTDSLIVLDNQALGYRIDMIIDFFTLNLITKILEYQVFPKFIFLEDPNERRQTYWEKNRQKTYEGSFRHFISSLALGKLKEEKFQLYQYGYIDSIKNTWVARRPKEIKNYKEVLLSPDTLGLQNFHFDNFLYCDYKRRYTSWLELLTDYVQIDTLGNCYDELELLKRGFWGKARMADVLPFDYEPNGK